MTHGLKREALAYCDEIGQTLMRQGNVAYVQLVDLQLFLLVSVDSNLFLPQIVLFACRLRKSLVHSVEIFNWTRRHTKKRHG